MLSVDKQNVTMPNVIMLRVMVPYFVDQGPHSQNFFSVYEWAKKARVFAPVNPFKPSEMFRGKAKSLL